jgi:UDP:flavonoid glycosyltransferase YjiC (YdhE family)
MAKALGAGHDFDAALCRLTYADVLSPLGAQVFACPALRYAAQRRQGPKAVPTATWGEFLGDLGFDDPAHLSRTFAWWREVMITRNIALVVCDYAPLALLAARSLEIPTVAVGQGFGLPPWQMAKFPLFKHSQSQCLHDEEVLLANVNQAVTGVGMQALRGLPEIYRAELSVVQTFELLDFYASARQTPYLPANIELDQSLATDGDEIFCYFSQSELENDAFLTALETLDLPRRGYLPNLHAPAAERLQASGMILEAGPVPVPQIVARSRLMVNAGQHGVLSLALVHGLPQICFPQHMEQDWHARAAAKTGAARVVWPFGADPISLREAIRDAYHAPGLAIAAREVAQGLRRGLGPEVRARLQAGLDDVRGLMVW